MRNRIVFAGGARGFDGSAVAACLACARVRGRRGMLVRAGGVDVWAGGALGAVWVGVDCIEVEVSSWSSCFMWGICMG
jgi:hypothetical protein